MTDIYKRICPECSIEIIYSSKKSLFAGIKHNGMCSSCKIKGNRNPLFGKKRWNEGIKWSDEVRNKISIGNKGKIISNETKLKISHANKGIKLSKEHKEKIIRTGKPSGMKGKHHTDETKIVIGIHSKGNKYRFKKSHSNITKRKMRESHIKRLKMLGICPRYNLTACKFIDNLNKKFGWNLQHALNGGESSICGYFVDGYDKERNIIFEYDEPTHYDTINNLKNKDVIRQKNIIEEIEPTSFLRYNEKIGKLYDIKTGSVIPIDL